MSCSIFLLLEYCYKTPFLVDINYWILLIFLLNSNVLPNNLTHMNHFFTNIIPLMFLSLFCTIGALNAQVAVTDNTGGQAPDVSVCYDFGTEIIEFNFPAEADGEATIDLTLPTGVEYVCGSVVGGGATLADAGPCSATAPSFTVTGLNAGASTTFTMAFDLEATANSTAGGNSILVNVSNSSSDCASCGGYYF